MGNVGGTNYSGVSFPVGQLISLCLPSFSLVCSGSTALVVYVVDGVLFVANSGDTRAVLRREGERLPLRLSVDHKPDSERDRLNNSGAEVTTVPGSGTPPCSFFFFFFFFRGWWLRELPNITSISLIWRFIFVCDRFMLLCVGLRRPQVCCYCCLFPCQVIDLAGRRESKGSEPPKLQF